MKPSLKILTLLVILAAVFSSSFSLKCHSCDSRKSEPCVKKKTGQVLPCTESNFVCYTLIMNNGSVWRGCHDPNDNDTYCNTPDPSYKCKVCSKDSCNSEDKL